MRVAFLLTFFAIFISQPSEARRSANLEECLSKLTFKIYEKSGWVKWDPEFTLHAFAVVLEEYPGIDFTEMQKTKAVEVGDILMREFQVSAQGASLAKYIAKYFKTLNEAKKILVARGILPQGVEILQSEKLPNGFWNDKKVARTLQLLKGKIDFRQQTMFELKIGDPRLKEVAQEIGPVSGKSIYKAAERMGGWKTNLEANGIEFNQYNSIWSGDRILELIKYLYKNKMTLNLSKLRKLYPSGIPGSEKIFGRKIAPEVLRQYVPQFFDDWWDAVEKAGYSRINYQKRVEGGFWIDKKNIVWVLHELDGVVDLHPGLFQKMSTDDPPFVALSKKRGIRINPKAIYSGALKAYKEDGWDGALKDAEITLKPLPTKYSELNWDKEYHIRLLQKIQSYGYSPFQGFLIWPERFMVVQGKLEADFDQNFSGGRIYKMSTELFGSHRRALKAAGIDYERYSPKKARAQLVKSALAEITRRKIPEYIYFLERFGYPATRESFLSHSLGIGNALALEFGVSVSGKKLLWFADHVYDGLGEALQALGIARKKTLKDAENLEVNAYTIPIFLYALTSSGVKWENREEFSNRLDQVAKILKFQFGKSVDASALYRVVPYYLRGEYERPTRESLVPEKQKRSEYKKEEGSTNTTSVSSVTAPLKLEKRRTVYSNMNEFRERSDSKGEDALTYTTYVSVTAPQKDTALDVEETELNEALKESVKDMDRNDKAIIKGLLRYLRENDSLEDMSDVARFFKEELDLRVTQKQIARAYLRLSEKLSAEGV